MDTNDSPNTGQAANPDCEHRFVRLEFPLVKVRKRQYCSLCGETVNIGESVYSWSRLIDGDGWKRTYAHPECYAQTKDWAFEDWECRSIGDVERPKNVSFIPD